MTTVLIIYASSFHGVHTNHSEVFLITNTVIWFIFWLEGKKTSFNSFIDPQSPHCPRRGLRVSQNTGLRRNCTLEPCKIIYGGIVYTHSHPGTIVHSQSQKTRMSMEKTYTDSNLSLGPKREPRAISRQHCCAVLVMWTVDVTEYKYNPEWTE